MADTITSSSYLTIKFPLTKDNETTSRSINVPNPKSNIVELNQARSTILTTMRSIDGIQYLFQPSNWRDTDEEEEAWQLGSEDSIEFELTSTTKTKLGGTE